MESHNAIFSLVPLNDRAKAVVARPENAHLVSKLDDGTLVLDIGPYIGSKTRYTLATLGRGYDADIYVEGPTISRIQCSFEVDRFQGAIMLYDRSYSMTTQVMGENSTRFVRGCSPNAYLSDSVNTEFGMGGHACDFIKFRLEWHWTKRQVEAYVKTLDDFFQGREDRRRARTMTNATDLIRWARVSAQPSDFKLIPNGEWLAKYREPQSPQSQQDDDDSG